jgi:cystathionine beta-lyase
MSKTNNFYLGAVNPPIYQASTLVFDNIAELSKAKKLYARSGTATNDILAASVAKLENAAKTIITSSGLAAISSILLAILKQNDHMLLVEAAYEPTRELTTGILKNFGVNTDYYPANAGKKEIEKLIKAETKIIFLESPSSLTFEIQDLAQIVKLAQQNNIITIIDNTWSAGSYLKALDLGIDISIQSLSKYISGHSDLLLGAISFKELKLYQKIWPSLYQLGDHASPQDCYLAFRGVQTLKVRLKQHEENALKIAKNLAKNKNIKAILYPPLKSFKQHKLFKQYFTGANGLMSIVFKDEVNDEQIKQFVDKLTCFQLGFSWGGYDSLVMYYKATKDRATIVRLSIGLEDVELLIADLNQALKHLC